MLELSISEPRAGIAAVDPRQLVGALRGGAVRVAGAAAAPPRSGL